MQISWQAQYFGGLCAEFRGRRGTLTHGVQIAWSAQVLWRGVLIFVAGAAWRADRVAGAVHVLLAGLGMQGVFGSCLGTRFFRGVLGMSFGGCLRGIL